MPAAALAAVEVMERMASTGFNYGRATSEPGVWYFPTGKIGIYYADDGTTLTVQAWWTPGVCENSRSQAAFRAWHHVTSASADRRHPFVMAWLSGRTPGVTTSRR